MQVKNSLWAHNAFLSACSFPSTVEPIWTKFGEIIPYDPGTPHFLIYPKILPAWLQTPLFWSFPAKRFNLTGSSPRPLFFHYLTFCRWKWWYFLFFHTGFLKTTKWLYFFNRGFCIFAYLQNCGPSWSSVHLSAHLPSWTRFGEVILLDLGLPQLQPFWKITPTTWL